MDALRYCAAAFAVLATGVTVADRIDIVSEAQADKLWTHDPAAPLFVAGYPQSAPDKTRDVCVSIGYLIDANGKTSTFTEMSSWSGASPDGAMKQSEAAPYVQVAALVVANYRFIPTGKPHPIYTASTFAFDGSRKLGEDAIRGQCRIADLPEHVARAKQRADSRGDLARARRESYDRDRSMVEPMGNGQY